ncbi:MAG: T9SS type A sorting domain-containing protein [Bacteroidota bacterium]
MKSWIRSSSLVYILMLWGFSTAPGQQVDLILAKSQDTLTLALQADMSLSGALTNLQLTLLWPVGQPTPDFDAAVDPLGAGYRLRPIGSRLQEGGLRGTRMAVFGLENLPGSGLPQGVEVPVLRLPVKGPVWTAFGIGDQSFVAAENGLSYVEIDGVDRTGSVRNEAGTLTIEADFLTAGSWRLGPVPAAESTLYLNHAPIDPLMVSLYDLAGKQLWQQKLSVRADARWQLTWPTLPDGIYLFAVGDGAAREAQLIWLR